MRRICIAAGNIVPENSLDPSQRSEQLSLFDAPADTEAEARERRIQQTILRLRTRYGKNAVLRGMNFKKGATMKERNMQVGGHKAG